jgi:hypothetical protein
VICFVASQARAPAGYRWGYRWGYRGATAAGFSITGQRFASEYRIIPPVLLEKAANCCATCSGYPPGAERQMDQQNGAMLRLALLCSQCGSKSTSTGHEDSSSGLWLCNDCWAQLGRERDNVLYQELRHRRAVANAAREQRRCSGAVRDRTVGLVAKFDQLLQAEPVQQPCREPESCEQQRPGTERHTGSERSDPNKQADTANRGRDDLFIQYHSELLANAAGIRFVLTKLGLPHLFGTLTANRFDCTTCALADDSDWDDIGVSSQVGARLRKTMRDYLSTNCDPVLSATGVELAELRTKFKKEKQLRRNAEAERDELCEALDDAESQLQRLFLEDRETKRKMSDLRESFIAAQTACGWLQIPLRNIGQLDCLSRKRQLPEGVPITGRLGVSELQSFVNDTRWHPVKVVQGGKGTVIDWEDGRLSAIEARYPSAGVGRFVVKCWQEIQEYNASAGYSFQVPWNVEFDRELTPAEGVALMCAG